VTAHRLPKQLKANQPTVEQLKIDMNAAITELAEQAEQKSDTIDK